MGDRVRGLVRQFEAFEIEVQDIADGLEGACNPLDGPGFAAPRAASAGAPLANVSSCSGQSGSQADFRDQLWEGVADAHPLANLAKLLRYRPLVAMQFVKRRLQL